MAGRTLKQTYRPDFTSKSQQIPTRIMTTDRLHLQELLEKDLDVDGLRTATRAT
jgi:hypothetical protein